MEVWGTFRGNEWGNKGPVVEVQRVEEGGKVIRMFEGGRAFGGKEWLVVRSGCEYFSNGEKGDGREVC